MMRVFFLIRLASDFFFFFSFLMWEDTDIELPGVPFPRNFRETVKTVVRRLFRVYAHIYSNHFDHICALGIEGVFN